MPPYRSLGLLVAVLSALPRPAGAQDGYWGDGRYRGRGCCEAPARGGGYAPWYVPPPVIIAPRPYSPPVVVVPMQPSVTYSRPPAEFVYWCDNPRGYYPNVTTCNGPWREQSATLPR